MSGRTTTCSQISLSCRDFFFGVLAEISRRCPAFGHCCAFSPRQTRRDQNIEWHFQAPLISDRTDQRLGQLGPWASSVLRSSESSTATLSQFGVKSALDSLRYSDTCPLIHYRFFFFLFAKIAFQLSLYAFETGFWPSPRPSPEGEPATSSPL
jgi:hypothetical protein